MVPHGAPFQRKITRSDLTTTLLNHLSQADPHFTSGKIATGLEQQEMIKHVKLSLDKYTYMVKYYEANKDICGGEWSP